MEACQVCKSVHLPLQIVYGLRVCNDPDNRADFMVTHVTKVEDAAEDGEVKAARRTILASLSVSIKHTNVAAMRMLSCV